MWVWVCVGGGGKTRRGQARWKLWGRRWDQMGRGARIWDRVISQYSVRQR